MARTKKHPGTLRLKGESWHLRLAVAGQSHYFTLGAISRQAAEARAWDEFRKIEKAAKRHLEGLPGSMVLSELLDKYDAERLPLLAPKTQRSYLNSLDRFREFFVDGKLGDPAIDAIRAGHVSDFLTWRRGRLGKGRGVASARTVQKDRAVLHIVFGYAEELELRDGNPVTRVKPPKVTGRDPIILNDDQLERLLAECGEHPMLSLYVLTLAETGARCESEALRLKWADVDLDGGFVFIPSRTGEHRTKSGKGRWVPLTPRLSAALREHFATYRFAAYRGKRTSYLFHHISTRRNAKAGERVKSFRSGFEAAVRRAKLPDGFRAHDLRHRRVTTWLAEGKALTLVKEAMGHSTVQTTMIYQHLAREHLRALVEEAPERERLRQLGT
jgi:integrase/recombinase XerD